MCPLVSAPNRGYADYQRIGNYDTGVLWSDAAGGVNTVVTSPVIDVSRYAYLGIATQPQASSHLITCIWYAESGAATVIGRRHFVVDSNNPTIIKVRLPNLGPFLKITLAPLGVVAYSYSINVFATNRVAPLEIYPETPVLIDQQGVAIVASGTAIVYPSDYYSGPARLMYSMSSANGAWNLQALNTNGVWDVIDAGQVATSNNTPFIVVTPSGAWRIAVFNLVGAAATYNLAITPSTTGAT